ncbi:hypothetical protein Tco_0049109 [Tanacetum coccineum]
MVDKVGPVPLSNESIAFDTSTGPSDVPPNLGLFDNVFELTKGGIIGGNYVVSDLPLKQSWTSTLENDYKGQVKAEQAYLNNMSALNYGNPLSNEGSAESLAAYQKRVEEVTNSIHQTDGMLTMAQAMNESMHNAVNGLRSENESLKSHYSMSCASYSGIFGDLIRV